MILAFALLSISSFTPPAIATTVPGGRFVDDDGHFAERAIEAAVSLSVTGGCATTRFCPDQAITREQMAAFLVRAMGYVTVATTDTFVDDDLSPFQAQIETLAAAGVTHGCAPGLFCPLAPVTRAEMASFLVRAILGPGGDSPNAFSDDDLSPHAADIDRIAEAGITSGCQAGLFCPGGWVTRGQMVVFLARGLGWVLEPVPPRPPVEFVSRFTTYHKCCEARVTNIHVMADSLDGVTILPGEVFSINQTLGPRTVEAGYIAAPILLNGESYCCAIGGGTSQFATTIYNAIFWGGYEIIDHKPHSRYIDRYPLGIEATMGYPWPDVVFRNNTLTPVTIKTIYTSQSITVELWGNDMGRSVTAVVTGSATWSNGGSVKVVRTVTEPSGLADSRTWYWTYLAG